MKQKITLEGLIDWYPGWEFDHPIFVLAPMFLTFEDGRNADAVVEDIYIDHCVNGELPRPEEMSRFSRAKLQKIMDQYKATGVLPDGMQYWKRVVQYDPDEDDDFKYLESFDSPLCHAAEGGLIDYYEDQNESPAAARGEEQDD